MFEYISLYRKNASGQHGKVIGFTIVQFIIAVLLPMAIIFGAMMLPLLLAFSDVSTEAVGVTTGIWSLVMILVFILMMIFVIYPVLIGVLRYFASAYRGKDFTFGEAYQVFKNGNYSKLIKIALLIFAINFILSLIIGFLVNILMTVVFIPLMPLGLMMEDPTAAMTGASVALIITAAVLMIVVMIISYIPYIILYIYSAVAFMVYIDEPKVPTMDKLKIAWNITFNSNTSMVKLFFSFLFMYIIMTVVMIVLFIGVALIAAFTIESPGIISILVMLSSIITIAVSIYVSYLIVGGVVAYYFVGRDYLDQQNRVEPNNVPLQNEQNFDL